MEKPFFSRISDDARLFKISANYKRMGGYWKSRGKGALIKFSLENPVATQCAHYDYHLGHADLQCVNSNEEKDLAVIITWLTAGARNLERATSMYSYQGVFTDYSLFLERLWRKFTISLKSHKPVSKTYRPKSDNFCFLMTLRFPF